MLYRKVEPQAGTYQSLVVVLVTGRACTGGTAMVADADGAEGATLEPREAVEVEFFLGQLAAETTPAPAPASRRIDLNCMTAVDVDVQLWNVRERERGERECRVTV